MAINLAINGYGRIGRSVLRALNERRSASASDSEYPSTSQPNVIAINELGDNKTIAHLTRYDSTHGPFAGSVEYDDTHLIVNKQAIRVFHEQSLEALAWGDLDIDVVLECTGAFSDRQTAEIHLNSGAKRVLFSQPADSTVDATIVFGVNDHLLKAEHRIISNASCTTNGIVPIIKILNDTVGIEHGMVTTLHSAMNDQPVIDAYHDTDLRKTRSAMQSMIPVDTGLAKGIERILPEMKGRFEAQAIRIPTVNVSAMDATFVVKQSVSVESINALLKAAAEKYGAIIDYTEEPLASCDFSHNPHSAIIDANQTRVSGTRLVKILVWFDNEWGFANRMLDVVNKIAQLEPVNRS